MQGLTQLARAGSRAKEQQERAWKPAQRAEGGGAAGSEGGTATSPAIPLRVGELGDLGGVSKQCCS